MRLPSISMSSIMNSAPVKAVTENKALSSLWAKVPTMPEPVKSLATRVFTKKNAVIAGVAALILFGIPKLCNVIDQELKQAGDSDRYHDEDRVQLGNHEQFLRSQRRQQRVGDGESK